MCGSNSHQKVKNYGNVGQALFGRKVQKKEMFTKETDPATYMVHA